jgi:Mycothiol maleylpyruvate isomerase N-terminal domain
MTVERDMAIAILEEGHRSVRALVARLTMAELERPGTIGGGDWSARDLVGHLTAWEEHALAALDAWRAGRGAPIQRALREQGLNAVNAATAAADRRRASGEVLRRSDAIHGRLIEALGAIPDATWREPPTRRSRRPLGEVVGSILGGPAGPFSHAAAHLPDLERYVLGR